MSRSVSIAALIAAYLPVAFAQSKVIASWTFENQAIAVNNSPSPSTGSGAAGSLGMDKYPTPNVGITADDVLAGATGDTGTNGNANLTSIWRVRAQAGTAGAANGWSSLAPIGTQGAAFAASTVGYNNIVISFDWYATTQGEANLQLVYTTDGTTWRNAPLTLSASDAGLTLKNNTTSDNTVKGSYVSITGGGQGWFPGLTATITDPAAANNAKFAIEMVNASTGADCISAAGTALNNTSGNWRFDNVSISGVPVGPTSGAPPQISNGGVVSAGSFGGFPAAAAGSWIEIYGTSLSPNSTRSWVGSDFNGNAAPTALDGVSVTVNNIKAAIDYISNTQVNVQVPAGVGMGSSAVVLTNAYGSSLPYMLTLNANEPGFLSPPVSAFTIGGKQFVVAQHADGSYVAPTTASNLGTPAKPGETLVIYGVGFGSAQTSSGSQIPFGQIVTQPNMLSTPLSIAIGGIAVTSLVYDGLAPNYLGLYQFNVTMPVSAPNNDAAPFTFNLGGNTGAQTLYIAIHN
jgi:uncharacterized protein (TIGR03437 family)